MSFLQACPSLLLLLVALTAVARCYGTAATSDTLNITVQWNASVKSADTVALVYQETIFLTAQKAKFGGWYNVIAAISAGNASKLWEYESFGEAQYHFEAVGLPSVSDTVFVLEYNLQPPNVTAISISAGVVRWSTAVAYEGFAQLVASPDGQSLYCISISSMNASLSQLTAIDVPTGATLFEKGEVGIYQVLAQCGAKGKRKACISYIHSNGQLLFLDGRTGAVLGSTQSTPPTSTGALVALDIGVAVYSPCALHAVDTTSYKAAWTATLSGCLSPYESYLYQVTLQTYASHLLVAATATNIFAFDATTGSLRWNASITDLCPVVAPAPTSPASVFYATLGRFPSPSLLSAALSCYYRSTGQTFTILTALSTDSGALMWWRYLSPESNPPSLPIGTHNFGVLSAPTYCSANYDIYDSTTFKPVAQLVWTGCGGPTGGRTITPFLASPTTLVLQEWSSFTAYQLASVRFSG